jgi:hypothetical protein
VPPTISVCRLSAWAGSRPGLEFFGSRNQVDANWHFIDNYSWKSGKHDIKARPQFRRTTITQLIDHNFRGTLSFD